MLRGRDREKTQHVEGSSAALTARLLSTAAALRLQTLFSIVSRQQSPVLTRYATLRVKLLKMLARTFPMMQLISIFFIRHVISHTENIKLIVCIECVVV